jgi:hypothetical protein
MPIPPNGISQQLIDEVQILCNTSLYEISHARMTQLAHFLFANAAQERLFFPGLLVRILPLLLRSEIENATAKVISFIRQESNPIIKPRHF